MTSLDPIRPDIAQAWNDLTDSTGLKLERAHLPEYLGEGETVTSLTGATYQDTTGMLVLTGRRLFFFARGKRRQLHRDPWEPALRCLVHGLALRQAQSDDQRQHVGLPDPQQEGR